MMSGTNSVQRSATKSVNSPKASGTRARKRSARTASPFCWELARYSAAAARWLTTHPLVTGRMSPSTEHRCSWQPGESSIRIFEPVRWHTQRYVTRPIWDR
jgi:hypothetical protein